ncbi:MAG: hypothetical protein ACYCTV_07585 [Leptospirales bacterium]
MILFPANFPSFTNSHFLKEWKRLQVAWKADYSMNHSCILACVPVPHDFIRSPMESSSLKG